MHKIHIGTFDATGILNNMDRFSREFSISVRKISSGDNMLASEEPAMISFSERIKSEINENTINIKNIRDKMGMLELERSKSLLKVEVMQRIRELAVQYNNDTLSDSDKGDIQNQVDELSKLLNSNFDEFDSFSSTLRVGVNESIDIKGAQIISMQNYEGVEFAIYSTDVSDVGEQDLGDLVSKNSLFIESVTGDKAPEQGYLYYPETSQSETDDVPGHSFDLSGDGVLDAIDKRLESFSGQAVEASARYKTLEFRLDYLMNKNEILKEHLDNTTATDLAEETVNLMKSKLMLNLGSEMLKLQQHLDRSMIESLLSSVQ